MPNPDLDPTALDGASSTPGTAGVEPTVGEFAHRWNRLDKAGRAVILGMIQDNAAIALRCFTRHDGIDEELERLRRLHEEATANNARLRVIIRDLVESLHPEARHDSLDLALDAARKVLA